MLKIPKWMRLKPEDTKEDPTQLQDPTPGIREMTQPVPSQAQTPMEGQPPIQGQPPMEGQQIPPAPQEPVPQSVPPEGDQHLDQLGQIPPQEGVIPPPREPTNVAGQAFDPRLLPPPRGVV